MAKCFFSTMKGGFFFPLYFFLLFSNTNGRCLITQENWGCQDFEMFEQCKRAQDVLDLYTTKMGYNLIHLKCYQHLNCPIYPPTSTGKYWCQNIDAYTLCSKATQLLQEEKTWCYFYPPQVDGDPVIGFTLGFNITLEPFSVASSSSLLLPDLSFYFMMGLVIWVAWFI